VTNATVILERIEQGDSRAAEELLLLVYNELRRLAAQKLAREGPELTLQPTALVHEAWLRLGGENQPAWQNKSHFLGAAAEAMRRILVERARRKLRLKRGGAQERVPFEEAMLAAPADDEKVLQVHDALQVLESEDPEKARIVKLRFFVGLKNEEIANLLSVSDKTIRRHWELAKVRLYEIIKAV
jgi:RNA polymerase sigma factor (TIGR02999 family)